MEQQERAPRNPGEQQQDEEERDAAKSSLRCTNPESQMFKGQWRLQTSFPVQEGDTQPITGC